MLSEVYLGLGSNLGDRRANVARGVRLVEGLSRNVTVSSLYETAPQGFGVQPAFLNAACRAWTDLDPFELLARLREAQSLAAPRPPVLNGPRALDVDILLFGNAVLETPSLTIPHPRMHERGFVLAPLAEIAPSLVHPTLGLSIRDLLDGLRASGRAGGVTPVAGPVTGTRRGPHSSSL